ncbi:MAG: S24 family peptidase [Helicobacteraceae bacterium]|nr:S24 family peptidase [Helicobacteraceae bacterium]
MLAEFGVSEFKHLDLIRIYGDSMEPFVANGEFVIVDRESIPKNNAVVIPYPSYPVRFDTIFTLAAVFCA